MRLLPALQTTAALLTLLITSCAPMENYGASVKSAKLQTIVDQEVSVAMARLHPKRMVVIVAEPKTGRILALSSRDEGSKRETSDYTSWCFEPGSVFKPVVESAALNEGLVTRKTRINCEHGSYLYHGKVTSDFHPGAARDLTLDEIIYRGSNIGNVKLALMLQDAVLCDYVHLFGFGEKSGSGIADEHRAVVVER